MDTNTISIDIDLLKVLAKKDLYNKYIGYIKEYSLISNTKTILDDIPAYFSFYPERDEVDWAEFGNWFGLVRHSNWKKEKLEMYQAVFTSIRTSAPANENIIKHFIKLDYASRVNGVVQAIFTGRQDVDLQLVTSIMDEYSSSINSTTTTSMFASTDLTKVLNEYVRSSGLEWRLEDLNVSVGPLHKSDFVLIAARPETGKTSLLCSEFTYMVGQLPPDREAIIFNNEERGKLFLRLVEAATGWGLVDIVRDEKAALSAYTAVTGGIDRIRVCEPEGGLTTTDIERVLREGKYGLIGINVLDKVQGFGKLDEVARMRELAKWCRGLASKYAPVIAVQQADASASGQRYLTMNQIYGSKTGMQGEADVILMLGCEDPGFNERYLSVAKNKLPGGPRTVDSLKHGKFEIEFDPSTGRFSSRVYRKAGQP